MRVKTLLAASRRYYFRQLIILGAAGFLASALISADFLAGSSVRKSIAAHNLGKIGSATHLLSANTPFLSDLAARIENNSPGTKAAPMLEAPLISVSAAGITERGLRVTGIDGRFTSLYETLSFAGSTPRRGEIWLNRSTATLLGCTVGARISLRIPRSAPGEILQPAARGLPDFTDREFTVTRILEESGPGRYQSEITQRAPSLLYVNLDELGEAAGIPGRANRILITCEGEFALPGGTIVPGDAGLTLTDSPSGVLLRSAALYLSPAIVDAAREIAPGGEAVYSSFITRAEGGGGMRPYLFFVSSDSDRHTEISPLLARETGARAGSALTLNYFIFSPEDGSLAQSSREITVDSIADESKLLRRRDDIPDFPGLDEGRSCREWESSLPIDLSLISENIERDWKSNGKRPLLILDCESARAITPDPVLYRFPAAHREEAIAAALSDRLTLTGIGAAVIPLRDELIAASRGSVDFAALFLSMSFFLIAAMLFAHAASAMQYIDARRREAGLLRAIGFHAKTMHRHYLREMLPVIVIPGIAGSFAGIALVQILLAALRTIWYGIVHTDALTLYVAPWIIPAAFLAGTLPVILISSLVIGARLRRMSAGEISLPVPGISKVKKNILKCASLACALAAAAAMLTAQHDRSLESALFFLSGTFLLGALLFTLPLILVRSPLRDRAILIVTAIALFISGAVSANRRLMSFDPAQSGSPAGGKAFIVETTLPVPSDRFPRTQSPLIPFLVYGKERANCLNLNALRTPGILGFDAAIMDGERIFTLRSPEGKQIEWKSLSHTLADGSIPAAIDASVLQWSLKKSPGEKIIYRVSPGREVTLTISALTNDTCLQGMFYIDKALLYTNFTVDGGASLFLAGSADTQQERRLLTRLFAQWGGSVRASREAIALFMELENTYLRIFQTMSMLAFIPGFGGLALLIRSAQSDEFPQRRLMRALGFSRKSLWRSYLRGKLFLLFCAAALSAAAALVTALPLVREGYGGDIALILACFYGAALASGALLIVVLGERFR